jgi:hypothetical protein
MSKSTLVTAVAGLCSFGLVAVEIDPSNPTQLNTSINPSFDYRKNANSHLEVASVEAQVAGPSFLFLGELGYGSNSATNKSDWRDIRGRFFHLPYENNESGATINAAGWSVDAIQPLGNYDKGVTSGYRTIAPGVITAHAFDSFSLYPNLIYNFVEAADSQLKQELEASGEAKQSQSMRLDMNISPVVADGFWLMMTPAYSWGTKNAKDGASFKVYTGFFFNDKQALALESQYSWEKRDGSLRKVSQGEQYYARLQFLHYF